MSSRPTLRYCYGFHCTASVQAALTSGRSPVTGNIKSYLDWRELFALHAQDCSSRKCPGPLMGAGIDVVDEKGRVLEHLCTPFHDWEVSKKVFRPASMRPEILQAALARTTAQLSPVRADLRPAQLRMLAARLDAWGVDLQEARSVADVAREFPRKPPWRGMPGLRPTIWNSRFLAKSLDPAVFRANPIRSLLEKLHTLPEPAGSFARAANMSALASMVARSCAFGHPHLASPIQVCARLVSANVLPLAACVRPSQQRVVVLIYVPEGWPSCGPIF